MATATLAWEALEAPLEVTAIAPYAAGSRREISLNTGDVLEVTGAAGDWWFGKRLNTNNSCRLTRCHVGAFPKKFAVSNESTETGSSKDKKPPCVCPYIDGHNDALCREILNVLREWGSEVRSLIAEQKLNEVDIISDSMEKLVSMRMDLLAKLGNDDNAAQLRDKIITLIEEGNNLLGLDMIVRVQSGPNKGIQANEKNTSLVDLFRYHEEREKHEERRREKLASATVSNRNDPRNPMARVFDAADELSTILPELEQLTQLELKIKACIFPLGQPSELYFSLYSNENKKFLTEELVLEFTENGFPADTGALDCMQVLFQDVDRSDYLSDLYLVGRIYRCGKLYVDESAGLSTMRANNGAAGAAPVSLRSRAPFYRRPYGVVVAHLRVMDIVASIEENRAIEISNIRICCPTQESLFLNLHESIIQNVSSHFESPKNALGLQAEVNVFKGPLDAVQQKYKSMLKDVPIAQKLYLSPLSLAATSSAIAQRNDFYVTVQAATLPSDVKATEVHTYLLAQDRNTRTVKMLSAVTRAVPLASSGNWVDQRSFAGLVVTGTNRPTLGTDRIRISFPSDIDVGDLSVVFVIYNCTHKTKRAPNDREAPVAFAIFRLLGTDGVFCANGEHKVHLYKWIKGSKLTDVLGYDAVALARSLMKKEHIVLDTTLVSHVLAQNKFLNSLLSWRKNPTEFLRNLEHFTFIDVADLSVFCRRLFDAMFDLLQQYQGDAPVCRILTLALSRMISFLVDSKASLLANFAILLDTYMERFFQHETAYGPLITVLKHFLSCPATDNATVAGLRELMKALRYLLMFIIRSRRLWESQFPAIAEQSHQGFLEDIRTILNELGGFLVNTEIETLFAPKMILLKYIRGVFDTLEGVLSPSELSHCVVKFVDTVSKMPMDTKSRGAVRQGQLDAIQGLVQSLVLMGPSCEPQVVQVCVRQLCTYMETRNEEEELRQSKLKFVSVVADMLSALYKARGSIEMFSSEAIPHMLPLMPFLVDLCMTAGTSTISRMASLQVVELLGRAFSPVSGLLKGAQSGEDRNQRDSQRIRRALAQEERQHQATQRENGLVTTCVINILITVKEADFIDFMEKYLKSPEEKKSLIMELLGICHTVLDVQPFRHNWFVMIRIQYQMILRVLQLSCAVLCKHFVGADNFEEQVWEKFFGICTFVLNSRAVQLEKMGEAKRSRVLKEYGDVRVGIMEAIETAWVGLGRNATGFGTQLTESVLKYCLIENPRLCIVSSRVYQAMISLDHAIVGNVDAIETRTLEVVDAFLSDGEFVEHQVLDFLTGLQETYEESSNVPCAGVACAMLDRACRMVTLVSDVQRTPTDEEDRLTDAHLMLLRFFEHENREGLYKKYVGSLCTMHRELKNYVEAGMVVLLHLHTLHRNRTVSAPAIEKQSDHLSGILTDENRLSLQKNCFRFGWENDLTANAHLARFTGTDDPKFVSECIELYDRAIKYFSQGSDYERSIALLKTLTFNYEYVLYDYPKVTECLQQEAQLYTRIAGGDRLQPSYYRVAYFGSGFDDTGLTNQQFVYKGNPGERIMEFAARIQARFPNADLIKTADLPDAAIRESSGQYIQVTGVDIADPSVLTIPASVDEVRRAPQGPPPRIGNYRRRDCARYFAFSNVKVAQKGGNEFANMYTYVTLLETKDTFPTIHRRSNVVGVDKKEFSPIESAIVNVQKKSGELQDIATICQDDRRQLNRLTMALNGMIDAAVQGGLKNYKDTFLVKNESASVADQQRRDILVACVEHQFELLATTLQIHSSLIDEALQGLQSHLEERLGAMRSEFAEAMHGPPEDPASATSAPEETDAADAMMSPSARRALLRQSMVYNHPMALGFGSPTPQQRESSSSIASASDASPSATTSGSSASKKAAPPPVPRYRARKISLAPAVPVRGATSEMVRQVTERLSVDKDRSGDV